MSHPGWAVRVTDVSKSYDLSRGSTRGALYDRVGSLLSRRRRDRRDGARAMWALRHVSFEVPTGQIFGVIGRNGSGKTTLLSILAKVTAPTEGVAEVRGRVAPLLQVGAGFHPQLTGRDNISLSGAILGMSEEEVAERFDDIVAFSEIGNFIDQPVKHYSSGMYSRLAYSVAAFLPAEIMLIDEVLAVGDAQFREKSHEHMRATLQDGRSVVYVGHTISVVRRLCSEAIVLDAGRIAFHGDGVEAADYYEDVILSKPHELATRGQVTA